MASYDTVATFRPNPANPPSGCVFHPRCRYVQQNCKHDIPELLEEIPNHFVSCHYAGELELKGVSSLAESK